MGFGSFLKKAVGSTFVGGALGIGQDDAGDPSRDAADTQAAYQRDALGYLKEREALPQQFREGALQQLGGLYGLEGGTGSQQQFIDQAKQSPLYESLLRSGDDAALRNRSMTGGLRSGGAIADTQEAQDRALLTSYNQQLQGIQGLANLPSNANQIAAGTAGIGQTMAQGQVAGAQADFAQSNQQRSQLMGLGQLGLAAFSDIRLKENIKYIGTSEGQNWYSWDWNKEASNLGLSGKDQGVMAHEVYESKPEAIGELDGYITVDYSQLKAPEVMYA
mgnify:CR=1 FL=1